MRREEFLERLRSRPAGSHLPAEQAAPELPSPPADLVRAFREMAAKAGCRVALGSLAELRRTLLQEVGQGTVLRGGEEPVLALSADLEAVMVEEPFAADWGVALADGALARTGSMCFVRRPVSPLTATLVPPRIAVLVPASRIVWDLADYLEHPPTGGSLAIVSGPSRSADIENDLSIGVHGPGDVLVLVWDDGEGVG